MPHFSPITAIKWLLLLFHLRCTKVRFRRFDTYIKQNETNGKARFCAFTYLCIALIAECVF